VSGSTGLTLQGLNSCVGLESLDSVVRPASRP